jgi:hypothetical protein
MQRCRDDSVVLAQRLKIRSPGHKPGRPLHRERSGSINRCKKETNNCGAQRFGSRCPPRARPARYITLRAPEGNNRQPKFASGSCHHQPGSGLLEAIHGVLESQLDGNPRGFGPPSKLGEAREMGENATVLIHVLGRSQLRGMNGCWLGRGGPYIVGSGQPSNE